MRLQTLKRSVSGGCQAALVSQGLIHVGEDETNAVKLGINGGKQRLHRRSHFL
jgi:hypothetical protein